MASELHKSSIKSCRLILSIKQKFIKQTNKKNHRKYGTHTGRVYLKYSTIKNAAE